MGSIGKNKDKFDEVRKSFEFKTQVLSLSVTFFSLVWPFLSFSFPLSRDLTSTLLDYFLALYSPVKSSLNSSISCLICPPSQGNGCGGKESKTGKGQWKTYKTT